MMDRDRELHEMADEGRALMSDFIKRVDALDIVAYNNVHGEITLNRYYKIIDGIYGIPSADVAPVRHGMWVDVDRMQMHDLHGVLTWGNSFMCTECNFKTFAVEGHMAQYHYCPNCGAKMDGDEDDD